VTHDTHSMLPFIRRAMAKRAEWQSLVSVGVEGPPSLPLRILASPWSPPAWMKVCTFQPQSTNPAQSNQNPKIHPLTCPPSHMFTLPHAHLPTCPGACGRRAEYGWIRLPCWSAARGPGSMGILPLAVHHRLQAPRSPPLGYHPTERAAVPSTVGGVPILGGGGGIIHPLPLGATAASGPPGPTDSGVSQ
jgi:hypothetical protein